ncbi:MAG: lipopolysaccharide biosynthesis protein [Calditrichia bacterium]
MKIPKLLNRLWLIVISSANTLVAPILNVAVSLLVVRLGSVEIWGEFVRVLIIVNLANHLIYWGNREYLLREYSRMPSGVSNIWQQNVSSRLVLLAPILLLVCLFPLSLNSILYISLWIGAAFLSQSFEAIIIFYRKFTKSLLIEIIALIAILSMIFWRHEHLSTDTVIAAFALGSTLKAILLTILFRKSVLKDLRYRFQKSELTASIPFLILGLTGMLQSRTDLYIVSGFLESSSVGRYQITINILIYLQTLAAFILQPFLKNIFRLPAEALYKLTARLTLLGCVILALAVPTVAFAIAALYQFELSLAQLIWAVLFVLPIYAYLPIIYKLYREEKTKKVVIINTLGILMNALLTLFLVQTYHITGALAGSALAQTTMAIAYWTSERTSVEEKK